MLQVACFSKAISLHPILSQSYSSQTQSMVPEEMLRRKSTNKMKNDKSATKPHLMILFLCTKNKRKILKCHLKVINFTAAFAFAQLLLKTSRLPKNRRQFEQEIGNRNRLAVTCCNKKNGCWLWQIINVRLFDA